MPEFHRVINRHLYFERYTRQAAAVLARADICRVTDSGAAYQWYAFSTDRSGAKTSGCCELFAVSRRIGKFPSLSE